MPPKGAKANKEMEAYGEDAVFKNLTNFETNLVTLLDKYKIATSTKSTQSKYKALKESIKTSTNKSFLDEVKNFLKGYNLVFLADDKGNLHSYRTKNEKQFDETYGKTVVEVFSEASPAPTEQEPSTALTVPPKAGQLSAKSSPQQRMTKDERDQKASQLLNEIVDVSDVDFQLVEAPPAVAKPAIALRPPSSPVGSAKPTPEARKTRTAADDLDEAEAKKKADMAAKSAAEADKLKGEVDNLVPFKVGELGKLRIPGGLIHRVGHHTFGMPKAPGHIGNIRFGHIDSSKLFSYMKQH